MEMRASLRRRAAAVSAAFVLLAFSAVAGCGGADGPEGSTATGRASKKTAPEKSSSTDSALPARKTDQREKTKAGSKPTLKISKDELESRRSLADLLCDEPTSQDEQHGLGEAGRGDLPPVDEKKLAAVGIRKLAGKHLTLYTDLEPDEKVDELPVVFDLAVPQWCEYFAIDPARLEKWQMRGYLMKVKERFVAQGLLPDDLPPFLHGYQKGHEIWLYEQQSAYYRRHLLLHEGTHGFMNLLLGGAGPPWYMEGTAELLGTHRWSDGRLRLRYFPNSAEEAPYWGRVKIIKDQYAAGRGMSLLEIMHYGPRAHLKVEPYAWCWAAAAFLDGHPQYQKAFRQMQKLVDVRDVRFSKRFYEELHHQWPQLLQQWQLFVVNMEYGYDVSRAAVQFKPGRPLPGEGAMVTVAADRSWQSSGVRLAAGTTYQIEASGRYQVADRPKIWWCEPGGVTIRYYQGRPLGMLLGALLDEAQPQAMTPLARPAPLGLGRTLTPARSGTLYLRINDSAAELADNQGKLTVRITAK